MDLDMDELVGRLSSAMSDEFDRVGVTGTPDVAADEDSIVISISGDQAQALVDALNRAADQRRR